jgi:hypothetical protein
MGRFGFVTGLGLGLAVACATQAVSDVRDEFRGGDHYQMDWTVLVRGQVMCLDPYVRPSEREIECRSASLK